MRIVAAVVKVLESGCVLPTSTCLIQMHNAQMVGERSRHQFAHVGGNPSSTSNEAINSVSYTSYGIPYSRVCGRIIAYQFGTPNGFGQQSIDSVYVDGISVTFGHPRNHIWTFAAAIETNRRCPCIRSGTAAPSFVNTDYFCEFGTQNNDNDFIDSNPLWDGQDCADFQACCEFNNPPWFCKQLDQTTTEDIEIRIMSSALSPSLLEDEDTPVQLIEIFVQ